MKVSKSIQRPFANPVVLPYFHALFTERLEVLVAIGGLNLSQRLRLPEVGVCLDAPSG